MIFSDDSVSQQVVIDDEEPTVVLIVGMKRHRDDSLRSSLRDEMANIEERRRLVDSVLDYVDLTATLLEHKQARSLAWRRGEKNRTMKIGSNQYSLGSLRKCGYLKLRSDECQECEDESEMLHFDCP